MSASQFLQSTVNGFALWPVYALTAAGFVIIYRATLVFNFAQGALLLLGAYGVYQLRVKAGISIWPTLILVIIGMAALGALTYLLVLKPMTGQPVFALIIVTMGLSIVATGLAGVIWGFSGLFVPSPHIGAALKIGSARISALNATEILVAAGILAGLGAFFQFTPIGLQMRATAESPTLASRRGVSVQRVYTFSWALAAAISAVAGAILAFGSGATPTISDVGLTAFPAALIGGFDSLLGAVIGGLIVALAQTYAATLWSPAVEDMVVFGLMLVVLIIRPFGLFGTKEVLRV
jgi:branched-chain amino acid transport system permease protein